MVAPRFVPVALPPGRAPDRQTPRRRMEWNGVEWSGMEWKLNETPKVGMWSRRRRAWGGAAAFATSTTRDDVT